MTRRESQKVEIPDFITDPNSNTTYQKQKFLGRGGFATCYEVTDIKNKQQYAIKVISKAQLTKPDQREKISQEIAIQKSVTHPHVVGFLTHFDDPSNIYIILELCSKRSLMELHKRRKVLTEPEIRYYTKQIAEACLFLHQQQIIHRDLKLGNLFINDKMDLKIGDFGLATKVVRPGERKQTLCGTPNYIAPEILTKKGHSYEVDTWSLGCIVYTLAVGKPPFETNDLKDTYKRIKTGTYDLNKIANPDLRVFVSKMLQNDPSKRPDMKTILAEPWLIRNYIPSRLPQSCLTMAPRFTNGRLSIMPDQSMAVTSPNRRPLGQMNLVTQQNLAGVQVANGHGGDNLRPQHVRNALIQQPQMAQIAASQQPRPEVQGSYGYNIKEMLQQLVHFFKVVSYDRNKPNREDEAEQPTLAPFFWISKWVDYTDKYGIGYELCDGTVGVLFNDITRILLLADEDNVQYIDQDGTEAFHTVNNFPHDLHKKVTLLKYFRNYMKEHLAKTGEKPAHKEEDDLARLPCLNNWLRTRNAIAFQLTNGTIQINFFNDHTKLILCPLMSAVTYINAQRDFRTFSLQALEKYGCSHDLFVRLRYAKDVIERLQAHKLSSNQEANGVSVPPSR